MLQLFVVLVSIEDMSDFYGLVFFVHRIDNAIFPLVHTNPFKACISEILQIFTVLRPRVSPERENLDKYLPQEFGVRHSKVFKP